MEVFRKAFAGIVFDCVHVASPAETAYAEAFQAMEKLLREEHEKIAAVVIEPIVQGAAGMRLYDPAYLRALRELTKETGVLLVCDEVFAGYGRTGPMWASEHAQTAPDLMCIGKVFSSLFPMAATLATDRVFDAFRGGKERAFYYGHTFCGNPLGAALAREVLAIYREERVLEQVRAKSKVIAKAFERMAGLPGVVRTRARGMIGAADLAEGKGYLGEAGWKIYEEARKRGAYLRPLGSTVYVTPPLTIPESELEELLGILEESVRVVMG